MRVWDLQIGETLKAFLAFQAYRDTRAQDRSIAKCCGKYYGKEYSKTRKRQWDRWSTRWKWTERLRAWESELDHVSQDATIKAVEEMRDKHVKEAQGLQGVAVLSLARLRQDVEGGRRQLSPSLILQYLTQGSVMERLARGEPNEIVENLGEDGVIIIEWKQTHGPGTPGEDATNASGPVDGPEE